MNNFFKKVFNLLQKILKVNCLDTQEKLVAYICGGEALPQALTAEEEILLIEKLANNDESAKNQLIEHNLRLVVYIAKRFENTGTDLEDLISVGAIGLIKAVQSFDVNKNINLATYASRCIENEILMHIRKKNKQNLEVSLDEPLNFDKDGNELLLSDILESEYEGINKEMEKNSEKKILWDAIKKLNAREQKIMELRFGLIGNEESTQKEVADTLGISQSYISRLEKRIIIKLKKQIEKTV
jgi:RNA polymerase sporulation-specific sigma factor